MKRPVYPFAAIVGQEQMKMALLLAAVDWRLGVLLRGDKGAGKTTTARALAEILPKPARFVNLPIGITEDRLLGGMDLGSTLRGEPSLRPGLLAEANGKHVYFEQDLSRPLALIVGNEAHGPSAKAQAQASQTIMIPLANNVESLNVAMATGILLYEAVRQRKGRAT